MEFFIPFESLDIICALELNTYSYSRFKFFSLLLESWCFPKSWRIWRMPIGLLGWLSCFPQFPWPGSWHCKRVDNRLMSFNNLIIIFFQILCGAFFPSWLHLDSNSLNDIDDDYGKCLRTCMTLGHQWPRSSLYL